MGSMMKIVSTHYGRKFAYEVVQKGEDHVIVGDMCCRDNSFSSITNMAEEVVKELIKEFGPDKRFFYIDTIGCCDELEHDGKKFTAFHFGCPHEI